MNKLQLRHIHCRICITAFAWLIGFALALQQASAQPATMILTGGKVFTADSVHPWAEAIAIRGERIIAIGTNAEITRLAGPATGRVDLAGRVVVPGFNDAHAHLGCQRHFATIVPTSAEPFADPSLAIVEDSLRILVGRVPAGRMIGTFVGRAMLADSSARRSALDRVAPRNPVWLGSFTGHGLIANTLLLRQLGITETAKDPVGGRFGREPGSSRVNGLLEEYAGFAANRRLCSTDPESVLVEGLRSTGRELVRFGVTSVQNIGNELEPALMIRVFRAAELPLRFRIIPTPMTSAAGRSTAEWATLMSNGSPVVNQAGGTMIVSGMKWILDGTPVERLATLRSAYRGRPGYFGRLDFPPDTIRALLLEARQHGQQLLLHAEGDSTIALILQLMEQTGGAAAWSSKRVRIEHGDGLAPELLARTRPLGIIVVQNPTHLMAHPMWSSNFEPAIMARILPLRSVIASRIPFAIGSDGPMNPFLNIMMATTHPLRPEEALTREQAVTAYTRGAAYAEFAEREKGALAPGMLADLAVLSQDIFVVPPPALLATTSVLTIVGGRVVYDGMPGAKAGGSAH